MVARGEIVEVSFMLPEGRLKTHPALVVSNTIPDQNGDFVYAILISSKNINPQYTIKITPQMLTRPLPKQSYFVTHILDKFTESAIQNKFNSFVKAEYFDSVIQKSIKNIFGIDIEFE